MYTDDEVCKFYRNADDRIDKMELLKDLTNYSEEKLIKILNSRGYEVKTSIKNIAFRRGIVVKDKFLEYYNLGWTDQKIAKAFGVAESTIQYWRFKNGLLANKLKKMPAGTGK